MIFLFILIYRKEENCFSFALSLFSKGGTDVVST